MSMDDAAKVIAEEMQSALGVGERDKKAFIMAPESADGLAASAILLKFLTLNGFRTFIRFFGLSPVVSAQLPDAAISINLGGPEDACKGCTSVRAATGSHGLPLPLSSIITEAVNLVEPRQEWAYRLGVIGSISAMADLGDGRKLLSELGGLSAGAERANALASLDALELPFGHLLPLYESLNISVDPYLKGLTGNPGVCISILKELGMLLVGKERHTTLKDLTGEQLSALNNGLEKYSQGDLKRTIYYDPKADESSVFWNYRDVALFLEMLILKGMTTKALQLLNGIDRPGSSEETWLTSIEELKALIKAFNAIINNKERMLEESGALRVVTTGLVGVKETAEFVKWLSLQKNYRGRIIVGETNSGSDEVLITLFRGEKSEALLEAAKKHGGKVVIHYPYMLFYVNVIKAGLLYSEIIKAAGVP